MTSEADLLGYWINLAAVRDETGLPVDMIFYACRERNALPPVWEKGERRSVTEDEFTQGIADCIAIRQGRPPKDSGLTRGQVEEIRVLLNM